MSEKKEQVYKGKIVENNPQVISTLTTYSNPVITLAYKEYRNYSGSKARAILTKLGSIATLPKKGRQMLIVDSPKVRLWLVNDKVKRCYYFYSVAKPQKYIPPSTSFIPEITAVGSIGVEGLMERWGVERRRY